LYEPECRPGRDVGAVAVLIDPLDQQIGLHPFILVNLRGCIGLTLLLGLRYSHA
jgi:hypothetical protein